ncbi:MAG: hypothetical protein WKF47_12700 [Geodermatophilaceae bacterium]
MPGRRATGLADISLPALRHPRAFTEPKMFNGLLSTTSAPEDESGAASPPPGDRAQGIFVNFLNVMQSARRSRRSAQRQIGKSFRNEDHSGNFIFRTREFEQMEMECFVVLGTDESGTSTGSPSGWAGTPTSG